MARYKNWGLIEKKSVAALQKHIGWTNSGAALAPADGSAAAQEGTRGTMGLPREEGEGFAEDMAKWGFGEAGHR